MHVRGDGKSRAVILVPPCWIVCSSLLTLCNKYMFSILHLQLPVTVTLSHLFSNSVVAFLSSRSTRKPIQLSSKSFIFTCLISICHGASIVMRNKAYEHMSVSGLQVLSAFSPTWVYLLSVLSAFETFQPELFVYSIVITTGVCFASVHDFKVQTVGSLLQCSGILLEGIRTILLKSLLHKSRGSMNLMDVSLYCSVISTILLCPFVWVEVPKIRSMTQFHMTHLAVFTANVMIAVTLNILGLQFVREFAPTTCSVTAVIKDLFLVFSSPSILSSSRRADHWWYLLSALGTVVYVFRKSS